MTQEGYTKPKYEKSTDGKQIIGIVDGPMIPPSSHELLPCPFCGGPATLISYKMWPWSAEKKHYYKCAICKASPGDTYTSLEEAAKIWNIRD